MQSSCLRYACSEAAGFPLALSRADALWPVDTGANSRESSLSGHFYLFFSFLKKKKKKGLAPPFRVGITESPVRRRSRGGGRGISWQQEREEKREAGETVFTCVVLTLGVSNPCV